MWRFKSFAPKEPAGLEGRFLDVGNLKIQVRNAIAEGGFSCVYLARDTVNAAKQYALKHIICNDDESLQLAKKEINVMKALKGHPNIVTLCAHGILDMGRTKEALLVMEFCDKSLVSVLENRGSGYFEEKQALSIFRDACNAVFAMHSLSPPVAHRDLKAENLLLGLDGVWKLCDFGSTSTNHKRFEKPEEMGIEEDNIRKYTTPAYRAPEMWDLLRRDPINEKVDIWALGCLLFRILYFRNAFDGESKLQVLNGNYRIPESPKYSKGVTDLIRDMLQASPDDRPDITQVWFRVNEQLPANLQKSLTEGPPEAESGGSSRPAIRSHPMPNRTPPAPPSSGSGSSGGQLGAFWSSQYAEDCKPKYDEPSLSASSQDKSEYENHNVLKKSSPAKDGNTRKNVYAKSSISQDGNSKDIEINFLQKNKDRGMEKQKALGIESNSLFQDEGFNTFVADFDSSKLNVEVNKKSARQEELEAEIGRLKDQLKQVNLEKMEITSKYEKLAAICRSQRQEIQELKQAKTTKTPSPSNPKSQPSKHNQQGGSDWSSSSPDAKSWQAFTDEPGMRQSPSRGNGQAEFESWGFGADSFTAGSTHTLRPKTEANVSPQMPGVKQPPTQPAGWAGF